MLVAIIGGGSCYSLRSLWLEDSRFCSQITTHSSMDYRVLTARRWTHLQRPQEDSMRALVRFGGCLFCGVAGELQKTLSMWEACDCRTGQLEAAVQQPESCS